jgi:two-component system, cell cycle sensor histidine kinase and response regulator CckA
MTPLLEVGAYSFSFHALGSLTTGILMIAFGTFIATTQRQTRGSLHFLLMASTMGIWLLAAGLMMAAPDPDSALNWWKASFVGFGAIPAAVYGFSHWLVGGPDRRTWVFGLLVGAALVLEVLAVGTGWPATGVILHEYGYFSTHGPGGLLLAALLAGGVGLSIWELRTAPSHGDPNRAGLRKGLLTFLLGPGVVVVVADFAPTFGSGTPPIGYMVVLLVGVGLFWTFRRFRLVDITPATTADSTLAAVTDGVAVCDTDGRIRVANPSFERFAGVPATDLIGECIQDVLPVGDDRDELLEVVAGEQLGDRRMTVFPPSGETLPVTVTGHALRDSGDIRLGTVVVVRDLTDRIFFEERLARSERLEAMGNLAGGVAHDFNNILMAVQGYAAILQEELGSQPISAQVRKGLAEIVTGTERATALTRQLLTFGSTDVVEGKVHDVRKILEECGPIIDRLVPSGVDLRVLVPPVPAMALVDPSRMEQVVMNLALNGRDAMPDGGILRIEVQVVAAGAAPDALELGEGWFVVVRVSDTGTGMSPEIASRAFEPFFTTRADGGGMGLSTVYGIVTQAGGKVDLQTEVGVGTTVTVYVPWQAPEEGSDLPDEPEPEDVRPGLETVVLIAEDNDAVRTLTSTVLTRAGYTVHAGEDGLKAYQLAESLDFEIDLLVTDLVMPQIGGRELHQMLVKKLPKLVTLFMSGHPGDPLDLSKVGGAQSVFLQKPFPPKALLEAAEGLVCGE